MIFLFPLKVSRCRKTIFLEGSTKIWVDSALRTVIEQESSHQLGHLRGLLLFRMRDGVRFPWYVTGLARSPK